MSPTPRNSKKVKVSVFKLGSKRRRADSGSGSMVVLKPKKTRRGKTIYTEVDAGPDYTSSDEGGKSPKPKRKPSNTPSHSKTTISALVENTPQWEAAYLDDQEPHVSRITKVRLRL